MKSPVETFAEAAVEYCEWVESSGRDPEMSEAVKARRLVAELYRRAIELPEVFSETEAPEIAKEEYDQIYRRFASLPFNYYSECFNPLVVPAEEPVTADLADDLADIWRDLKPGVLLFQAGEIDAATWQWRFHFEIHWGHHATGALYALQSWLSNQSETLAGTDDSSGGLSNSA